MHAQRSFCWLERQQRYAGNAIALAGRGDVDGVPASGSQPDLSGSHSHGELAAGSDPGSNGGSQLQSDPMVVSVNGAADDSAGYESGSGAASDITGGSQSSATSADSEDDGNL